MSVYRTIGPLVYSVLMSSVFDMYFMQMIMYCNSMKCLGKVNLVFRWEYLRTFCCSPKSIFDRFVTHFLHVIFVYMYLLLLHFMFPGENKELN